VRGLPGRQARHLQRLHPRADRKPPKKLKEAVERLANGWDDTRTTTAALAAFGLQAAAPATPEFLAIWPENWSALQVFKRMLTQLATTAAGGVIGLRYESLPFVMRVCGVKRSDWSETMDCIQIMERRLIEIMNDRN
jgi:hypothetical protein